MSANNKVETGKIKGDPAKNIKILDGIYKIDMI